MSSDPRPLASPCFGRRAVIAALVAITAVGVHGGTAPRVWSQGAAGAGGHGTDAAHDRQGWGGGRKADEAVNRAAAARARLGRVLDHWDEGWCPKTPGEWAEVLDAAACFLSVWDIWRALKDDTSDRAHTEFSDAFKGDPQGDEASKRRHARGEQMRDQLRNAKQYRTDVLALIRGCDKTNAPVTAFGLEPELLRRVADKKTHELGLIGMAPLLIVDCPQCRPRVSLGVGGIGGSGTTFVTSPSGGAGGAATGVGGAAGTGGAGGGSGGSLLGGTGATGGAPAPGRPAGGGGSSWLKGYILQEPHGGGAAEAVGGAAGPGSTGDLGGKAIFDVLSPPSTPATGK